ncbi:MAG: hypothetical protein R2795_08495 [Saprospiraceae bacterium]
MLHATTLYIAPTWLPRFSDSLVAAQSTRHGGVSPAPFKASTSVGTRRIHMRML